MTGTKQVAGYIALSTVQVVVELLPEELRVGLPRYPGPAVRIGKIAVNLPFNGAGGERWLFWQAFLIDAIDDKAKNFYLRYGFIPLKTHPLTLVLPKPTIKAAIGS